VHNLAFEALWLRDEKNMSDIYNKLGSVCDRPLRSLTSSNLVHGGPLNSGN